MPAPTARTRTCCHRYARYSDHTSNAGASPLIREVNCGRSTRCSLRTAAPSCLEEPIATRRVADDRARMLSVDPTKYSKRTTIEQRGRFHERDRFGYRYTCCPREFTGGHRAPPLGHGVGRRPDLRDQESVVRADQPVLVAVATLDRLEIEDSPHAGLRQRGAYDLGLHGSVDAEAGRQHVPAGQRAQQLATVTAAHRHVRYVTQRLGERVARWLDGRARARRRCRRCGS